MELQAATRRTISRESSGVMLDCKVELAAILLGIIRFVAEPAAVQDVTVTRSLQRGQFLQKQRQAVVAACERGIERCKYNWRC